MFSRIKKIIAITILLNYLGCNACFAGSYAQIYSQDLQNQLQAILTGKKIDTTPQTINSHTIANLKEGTAFAIELSTTVNSENAKTGDCIHGKLIFPVEENNMVIIPENSKIVGKILKVKKASTWAQNAVTEIEFQEIIFPDGYKVPISGKIKTKDNSGILLGANAIKSAWEIASTLGITTIGGGLIGLGIGLFTPHALIYGSIIMVGGFVAGITKLCFKKGNPVYLPSGTKLIITLQNDVSVNGV